MTVQTAPAAPLLLGNLQIRRDRAGRYCLNDLHQAAGSHRRHQPANWLRLQQVDELVAEIERCSHVSNGVPKSEEGLLISEEAPLSVVNDGFGNGTYAAKPLVYAYAMWISPKFHLAVIAAYDALVTVQAQPAGHASTSAALHTARARVVNRLYRAHAAGEIDALHAQAAQLSLGLGLPVPEVPSVPVSRVEGVLVSFWNVVDAGIAAGQLHSHARNPAWLALNLPEVRRAAELQGAALPASTGLTWALIACPRLLHRSRAVNSPHQAGPIKCWVFSA